MKKILLALLFLCSTSYGLSGYSLYKTYVSKDTVTHINLDSNFYRGVNWSNKLVDTVDKNFIRWYDFNSHDSTLRYFKVDTIRSNPHIDSLQGNIVVTGSPTITGAITGATIYVKGSTNGGANNLQEWKNTGDSIRMQFGDISVSNSGPALKIVGVNGLSDQVELALCQNVSGGLRNYGGYFTVEPTNSDFQWRSRTNNQDTTRLKIKNSNGFMGVNISNPTSQLHIYGYQNTWATIDASGTYNTGLQLKTNGTTKAYIYYQPSDTTIRIADGGAISAITINKNRNVGVSTTFPQYPLHVSGEAHADSMSSTKFTANSADLDSLFIGGTRMYYDTGSFPCSLATNTTPVVDRIKYSVVGKTVTMRIPVMTGHSDFASSDSATQIALHCGSVPAFLSNCDSTYSPCVVFDGIENTRQSGSVKIKTNFVTLYFQRDNTEAFHYNPSNYGFRGSSTFTYIIK